MAKMLDHLFYDGKVLNDRGHEVKNSTWKARSFNYAANFYFCFYNEITFTGNRDLFLSTGAAAATKEGMESLLK